MSVATISVAHDRTAPTLERVTIGLLLGFVAALQLSIAVAQTLLWLMLICWVALRIQERTRPTAPRFFIPLLGYAALTLVSSVLSIDPTASLIDSRQLLLFAIV